jgi:hypothetical protein
MLYSRLMDAQVGVQQTPHWLWALAFIPLHVLAQGCKTILQHLQAVAAK